MWFLCESWCTQLWPASVRTLVQFAQQMLRPTLRELHLAVYMQGMHSTTDPQSGFNLQTDPFAWHKVTSQPCPTCCLPWGPFATLSYEWCISSLIWPGEKFLRNLLAHVQALRELMRQQDRNMWPVPNAMICHHGIWLISLSYYQQLGMGGQPFSVHWA